MRRSIPLRLHALERPDAPATLVGNNKLTYQDADGDNVSVTLSKPILTPANVNNVFTFNTGTVDGSNTTKQQLPSISLESVATLGSNLTLVVTRSPVNGGDGYEHMGHVSRRITTSVS